VSGTDCALRDSNRILLSPVISHRNCCESEEMNVQTPNANPPGGAAASGLESAASALHERADSLPGGERVASAAHTAASALGSTADYVRENDLKSMMADMQRLVKNNPGPALLTAAALGFLIARTLSRD
jgi:hypothetical protein